MEASSRLTSGHMGAHPAGERNGQAAASGSHAHRDTAQAADDPESARAAHGGQAGKAGAAPSEQEEGAKETGRARGAHRIVIASYTKFKGIAVEGVPPGDADPGRKPAPVPAAQLIGSNLDVRV